MNAQMIRVISSPSSSTIGLETLILSMVSRGDAICAPAPRFPPAPAGDPLWEGADAPEAEAHTPRVGDRAEGRPGCARGRGDLRARGKGAPEPSAPGAGGALRGSGRLGADAGR